MSHSSSSPVYRWGTKAQIEQTDHTGCKTSAAEMGTESSLLESSSSIYSHSSFFLRNWEDMQRVKEQNLCILQNSFLLAKQSIIQNNLQ